MFGLRLIFNEAGEIVAGISIGIKNRAVAFARAPKQTTKTLMAGAKLAKEIGESGKCAELTGLVKDREAARFVKQYVFFADEKGVKRELAKALNENGDPRCLELAWKFCKAAASGTSDLLRDACLNIIGQR